MSDYFIYTGNAYPHKNLSRLIDAILQLKVNLKIVCGRNVFTQRLEKEIKQKRATDLVQILGFISDKKLASLYKNSIAFVFPTLDEGFGLPPMEAINAGTMAVVSEIPVLKEVYEDSVFYFDPLDVDSIANKLLEVAKISKEDRRKVIKKSQEYLKKYSWSKMAKETLKIYEEII